MTTIQLNASKKNKQVFALQTNINALVENHGINKIGFLTLTFADDVQCHKEATKRFNSLATNVLKNKYAAWIRISERQKSGRWHFHLVVACKDDIRRGLNFSELKNKIYKSANKALRQQWQFWRDTSKKYNFGRTELLPIKTNSRGIAAYLAKYLSKSTRKEQDKGARLVSYSNRVLRACTQSFSWIGARKFRQACQLFFTFNKLSHDDRYWFFKHGEQIRQLSLLL